MKYKINPYKVEHFTHNDADAIGCAIVVDLFIEYNDETEAFDDISLLPCVWQILKQHVTFNSLHVIDKRLKTYISQLNDILSSNEDEQIEIDENLFEFMDNVSDDGIETAIIPKYIFISDVPLSKENADVLDELQQKFGIEPLYVDHHSTNNMNGYKSWCHVKSTSDFDGKEKSAAWFLREQLFGLNGENSDIMYTDIFKNNRFQIYYHILIDYIDEVSRYDTYYWKKEPNKLNEYYTNAVKFGCGSNCFKAYEYIKRAVIDVYTGEDGTHPFLLNKDTSAMITIYDLKKDANINNALRHVIYTMGYNLGFNSTLYSTATFAIFICPGDFTNDIFEAIYNPDDSKIIPDVVIGLFPNTRTVSFRRGTTRIDLGEFASSVYGGGGHKDASGAILNTHKFMELLEFYYNEYDKLKS